MPALVAAPNVIPMADIMLVLLIIFMIITPLMQPESLVRMAKAKNADQMPYADRDDAIVVAVTRDGNFFLTPGNREVGLNMLGNEVKDLVAGRTDRTVYVRSDARAKYHDVVGAVDQVRTAGIEHIGLLTEKISSKSGAPR
ncbi:MAG: biopolymer transporter ExbD [Candidatus Acidiferrales bacterium]